jgi:hypothetical protein
MTPQTKLSLTFIHQRSQIRLIIHPITFEPEGKADVPRRYQHRNQASACQPYDGGNLDCGQMIRR